LTFLNELSSLEMTMPSKYRSASRVRIVPKRRAARCGGLRCI
jgi:hypothetical protein